MFPLILVDGNNRVMTHHRADSISGVSRMINEVRRAQARYCAQAIILFDHPEASESRRDLYEGYKANRDRSKAEEDSEAIRSAVLRCCNEFPVWYDSSYEADDLIATISEAYPDCGMYILSRDSDLNVLLRNPLRLQITSTVPHDLMSEAEIVGRAMVEAKLGIKLEQFDEYRALIGDSSDNLPGVKGIGPKTARQILSEYDTVEMAVAAGSRLSISKTRRKALKKAWDNSEFSTSLKLTQLATDAEVPEGIDTFIKRILNLQPKIRLSDIDW